MRHSHWLVATVVAAAPALAQGSVALPVGQNLHDRPDQAGDVVIEINSAGTYALNGRPVTTAQLAGQLAKLMSRTRDRVVYIRADAHLPSSTIDSATAIAARGDACVASFVGTQEPGTVSYVSGDAGQEAGGVRRAIDVQLPLPRAPQAMITRQQAAAIVLEVLSGPAYRINAQTVPADNLKRRLHEIYDPRPIKVLYVRADPAAAYEDVFHAMDAARYAGVVDIVAAPPELAIRATLPDIDLSMRVTARNDSAAARIDGNIGRCRRGDVYLGQSASSTRAATDTDRVFLDFQVERPVKRLPDGVVLHYPDVLRASQTNGEVLAQFVVDTNGRALPETFKVIKTTHDLFAQAVKAALPGMRFVPATIGGKPVRQLVQAPFHFAITP
ncbi:MAG TPA: biopolymer transporter ExbD [Gemmatimonadaceae bacterium]|nr:biopolymer transporter ExbD [Gemmatimonadaceae bacterium]